MPCSSADMELDRNRLTEEETKAIERRFFNDLYFVVLQRDAHIGFLKSAEQIIGVSFSALTGIFKRNYFKYMKIRPLFYVRR